MSQNHRRKWTAAEKMRIVMTGMQKDVDVAELCRRCGGLPPGLLVGDDLLVEVAGEFAG